MSDNTENVTGPGLEPTHDVYTPPPGVTVGNYKHHPAYRPTRGHIETVREHLTPGPITELILECHGAAWDAGWWHDPRTGKPLDRNAGEMLMLQVSELAEAAHGAARNLLDDKLPHRQMVEVEIGDFLIRLYDYCGGLRLDLEKAVAVSEATEPLLNVIHPFAGTPALWQTVQHLCDAMEGHRKNDTKRHVEALARAHRMITWYARVMAFDVEGARIEKMAFNKTRPDHQIAARLAPGGKAY